MLSDVRLTAKVWLQKNKRFTACARVRGCIVALGDHTTNRLREREGGRDSLDSWERMKVAVARLREAEKTARLWESERGRDGCERETTQFEWWSIKKIGFVRCYPTRSRMTQINPSPETLRIAHNRAISQSRNDFAMISHWSCTKLGSCTWFRSERRVGSQNRKILQFNSRSGQSWYGQ